MPVLLLDDRSFKLQPMSPNFVPSPFPYGNQPPFSPSPVAAAAANSAFLRCIPAFFGNSVDEDVLRAYGRAISGAEGIMNSLKMDGRQILASVEDSSTMEQWAANDPPNASPARRNGEFLWAPTHESPLWNPTGSVVGSPTLPEAMLALQKFLPSNEEEALQKFLPSNEEEEASEFPSMDLYSGEEFRMFEFKVRRCMRGRSHDWTECPFAHPGEKARRRDPRRFHYSGTPCPDFRKGSCKRGDACEFAHGVFECWLHPARYRTQPCKDGRNCRRRVCFFAHSPDQLRLQTSSNRPSPTHKLDRSFISDTFLDPCPSPTHKIHDRSFISDTFLDPCVLLDPDFSPAKPSVHRFLAAHNSGSGFLASSPHNALNFQLPSPTSPLLEQPQSSPSLSPPLSPSISSPGSPSNPLAKSLTAAIPGTPLSPLALHCKLSQLHGQSGLQESILAHRRHWDRMNPSVSISLPADQGRSHSPLPSPTSACAQSPTNLKMDFITQLKQLELAGDESNHCLPALANMAQPRFSSGPSLLRRSSQSVPGTPTKLGWKGIDTDLWNLNEREAEPILERVESGRGLRAKIFESLLKGKQQEINTDPDLDWVNELVEDELQPQSKE